MVSPGLSLGFSTISDRAHHAAGAGCIGCRASFTASTWQSVSKESNDRVSDRRDQVTSLGTRRKLGGASPGICHTSERA
jgi:hypothetical protein